MFLLLAQADQTQPSPPVEDTLEELARLTATDWLVAASIIVGAAIVGVLLRSLTIRVLRPRSGPLVAKLLGRLGLALIVAVGVVYALNQVGVSIGPVLGLLGLLGLALALALQEVLQNFIAGVMLSLQRPFRVGDQIRTGGYEGVVEDVTLRSVTLRTYDGVRVFVPNATVWDEPIENATTLGGRRTTLTVGVGYGSDLDKAQTVLLEAAASVEGVRDEPMPQALVNEFGDSSVNFAVRFWHDPDIASEWEVRDRLARTVKMRLDEEGIEIPFPQLVLHRDDSSDISPED